MPDGASNSHCMCLTCGLFRHLGRQRGGVTENTSHPDKKGDGRHAPMNKGVSTAGAPPQILVIRAMRGSSGANSGGGARARTCWRSCYTVSGLGTRDDSGPCGASQSMKPDHGMNRR
jgi:hypothetical protein